MSRRWWPAGACAPPPHSRWWPAGAAPPCDDKQLDKHFFGGFGGNLNDGDEHKLHHSGDHDKHDNDEYNSLHDKHFLGGFGGNLNDEHDPLHDKHFFGDDRDKHFFGDGDEHKLHHSDGHGEHDNDDDQLFFGGFCGNLNDEHGPHRDGDHFFGDGDEPRHGDGHNKHRNGDSDFFGDGDEHKLHCNDDHDFSDCGEHKLHHNDGHGEHDNDLHDSDNDKHFGGNCGHDVGEALRYIIDKLCGDHGKHENDEYKPHDDHGKHFSVGSLNDEHEPHLFGDHGKLDNDEYKPLHDKHFFGGFGGNFNDEHEPHHDDDHDQHPFDDGGEYNPMDVVYDELMVLTKKGMRAVSLDEVLGRSCLAEDEVQEALWAWASFGVVREEKGILLLVAVL